MVCVWIALCGVHIAAHGRACMMLNLDFAVHASAPKGLRMPSNPVCLARKIAKISGSGRSTTVANFEASFAADAILSKFDGNILDKPMPMGTVYTATENPAPQTPSSAGQAFAGSPRTSFCKYWGGHSFLQTTVAVPHAANSIATD